VKKRKKMGEGTGPRSSKSTNGRPALVNTECRAKGEFGGKGGSGKANHNEKVANAYQHKRKKKDCKLTTVRTEGHGEKKGGAQSQRRRLVQGGL